MARKKKPPERVNHERWLVSYADFITLLFAFFTTLYAISTVDAKKMGKMVMSMKASFDSAFFEAGSDRMSVMEPAGNGAAGKETSESVLPQKSSSVPSVAEKLRESIRGGRTDPLKENRSERCAGIWSRRSAPRPSKSGSSSGSTREG